jgi:signal transduction histidine kinase
VTTAAALAIDYRLGTFATEATDAFYIMAAAASAFVGRWPYALLSIGLAVLPNAFLFNHPHYSLAIGVYGWEHVIVNAAISFALALLVSRLRTEQNALKSLNDQLEDRVEKRTADLEESNRQLEAFCYTLAHDLRAPLRAIQGFSQITVAEYAQRIGAEPTETLNRIATSAEMMGRLIHDLLVYTQLHRSEIPLGETNLQQVVERVLQILAPEIDQKHAIIEVIAPLPSVTANFVLAEQIVLNLVSNALTFTRDNVEPHVRIWHEHNSSSVRLSIQDNGVGIAPSYLRRIFEPFQRLNLEKTTGTGIGLAFAKKGIERLGGKIGVDSTLNSGSRFWIELPR